LRKRLHDIVVVVDGGDVGDEEMIMRG